MLFLFALPAIASDPAAIATALESDDGWRVVGEVEADAIGAVEIRHRTIEGHDCLEGNALTSEDPATLMQLARDIPANMRWSSADVRASEYLSPGAASASSFDYYQYLNNPPPISDRYWYLQATIGTRGDALTFTWRQLDPDARYPEHHAQVQDAHRGAVMTALNVGSWRFTPEAGQTRISYRLCTEAGGQIPRWAGELAAKTVLPNNLRDIVLEAQRLDGP